jgi:hypothetical protein
MIRKLNQLAVAIVASMVLSACATLPTVSSNQLGPEINQGTGAETLYYSPNGPVVDSTQEQIISDFFYAGNGPQEDYAVAREFLTPSFASKWKPTNETLIQTGSTRVVSNFGTKVQIMVPYDAKIAADGTYRSTPGATQIIEVKLLQVSGQWRISSAPNLTILLRPNFDVLFDPVSIYFWDKSFSFLVPEVRWFPTRAAIATRITNAILAGPSEWLAPAVQTIIPPGTKLNINSVTVTSGVAAVDFSAKALEVPEWKRPYLKSQLVATLGELEGVSDVSISIQRTKQEIATGSSGMPSTPSNLPIALTTSGLVRLVGTSTLEISKVASLIEAGSPKGFAMSSDESLLALQSNGAIYAYDLGLLTAKSVEIDNRTGLINPTIDPFGRFWTVTDRKGASFRISTLNGTELTLPNPLGYAASVKSIAMSPEGSRLAILYRERSVTHLVVASVVRDEAGSVIEFGDVTEVSGFDSETDSISWVDRIRLIGLHRDSGGNQAVLTSIVGGDFLTGRIVKSGKQVTSTPGGTTYYLDDFGTLFASSSFSWSESLKNVLSLRMAGQ